jgi:hypothetical protein
LHAAQLTAIGHRLLGRHLLRAQTAAIGRPDLGLGRHDLGFSLRRVQTGPRPPRFATDSCQIPTKIGLDKAVLLLATLTISLRR